MGAVIEVAGINSIAALFTGPFSGLSYTAFESIADVQEPATRWLWTYNNERPNMAIGGITAIQILAMAAQLHFYQELKKVGLPDGGDSGPG